MASVAERLKALEEFIRQREPILGHAAQVLQMRESIAAIRAEVEAVAFEMRGAEVWGDRTVRVQPKCGPAWGASSAKVANALWAARLAPEETP